MTFQFASCERSRALEFLKQLYPSRTITDTPESAGKILDYVERDIIRIPDPAMHGPRVAIYPSKNWKPEMQSEIHAALLKFHEGK